MTPTSDTAPLDYCLTLAVSAAERSKLDSELSSFRESYQQGKPVLPKFTDLGATLATLAFRDEELKPFARALAQAQREGRRLRIWLRPAKSAEAAATALPWEFMRLDDGMHTICANEGAVLERDEGFLALHPAIEFVRAVQDVDEDSTATAEGIATSHDRMRILLVCVDNPGARWGFAQRAKAQIDGIEKLLTAKLGKPAEIRRIDGASITELTGQLEEFKPGIVHFTGHGALPGEHGAPIQSPALVLAGRDTKPEYLEAHEFARMCVSAATKVVVLNCCNLAAAGPRSASVDASVSDAESSLSLADRLSREGVALVVAMQLPVFDTDAELFAHWLYRPLLQGYALESAVARHRYKYRETRQVWNPAWAAPVVYARSRDTVVLPAPAQPADGGYDFDELIRTYQIGFLGREWLFHEVDTYLANPQSKIFFLSGPAGIGKTAFLAACVRRHERTAHAFYRYGDFSRPLECATHLLRQLNIKFEPGQAATTEGQTRAAIEAMGDALRARVSAEKLIVVVDGLDESQEPAEALPIPDTLLGKLPDNVAVIIAARPEWYETWRSQHPTPDTASGIDADHRFRHVGIDPLGEDNLRDTTMLIWQQFRNADASATRDQCRELATIASGNFLVISLLGDEFRRYIAFPAAEALYQEAAAATTEADGIAGLYRLYFDKHVHANPAYQNDRGVVHGLLGILAAAREEVNEEQLRALLASANPGLSAAQAIDVSRGLRHLRRFLRTAEFQRYTESRQIDSLYLPYHASFALYAEHAIGAQRVAGARHPDFSAPEAQAYAQAWAEYCLGWRELKDYPWRYALRHLPTHLMVCNGAFEEQLSGTLLDYGYMAAAIGAKPGSPRPLGINELLVHYSEALDSARNIHRPNEGAHRPGAAWPTP